RAAELIRRRRLQAEVAAALDHWTTVRHATNGRADPFWRKLQALANAVDPDTFRVRLRRSWAHNDFPDAGRIAASAEALDQPMPVLMSLAMPLLILEGEGRHWRELLVRIHRRHPDDFWVNFALGYEKPNAVDALRFSTAAVAIRPANAGAR